MKAKVFYGMPDAEYRNNDRLSYSLAHLLLSKSPRHANLAMSQPRKPRSGMSRGTLIHEIMLGGDSIEVLDVENFKSNAAKELRDIALRAGKVPVKRDEYDHAKKAAVQLLSEMKNQGVFLGEHNEVSIFWEERAFGGDVVQCRTRIDNLNLPFIYDLKVSSSADDDTCSRHAANFGYDIQAAIELRAVAAAFPEWADRLRFVDVFLEVDEPPYLPNPLEPDPEFLSMGDSKVQRAIDIWATCTRNNEWPGYSHGIRRMEAPRYALTRHEEQMAASSERAVDQW